MNNFEKLEENSLIIFEQNQFFSDETTQLLHQQLLVLYPQINEKEFNQIIQNVVDCLSSLISIFKTIPLKIRQIGVESLVQGKQEVFYFQIDRIERNGFAEVLAKNEYCIEFDVNK